VADDKKSPDDDDKTIVDIRRSPQPPADDDRTMVAPRNPPAAPPDEDRTIVMAKRPAHVDDDRTQVRSTGEPLAGDSERTMVRPTNAAPAASSAAAFAIICLSGPAKGQRFPIARQEATIGSSSECTVRLPDTEPRHARIVIRPDGVDIESLGGAVVLRGSNVSRTQLKSGDLVKLGPVVARFVKVGEVFSSSYTEEELAGSGMPDVNEMLRNPRTLALGAVAILAIGVLIWFFSASSAPVTVAKKTGPSAEEKHAKEVQGLIASGEVLFNADRLVAPPDQPDAENAYRTFNRVIEIDPGNEKARTWLERIDAELKKQSGAREAAEKERQAREREARERARRELAEKVNAILAQGDVLFDRGDVAEPVGNNALVKYREALQVDPESTEAKDRVRKAAYFYVQRGDEFREKDNLWAALENYRKWIARHERLGPRRRGACQRH